MKIYKTELLNSNNETIDVCCLGQLTKMLAITQAIHHLNSWVNSLHPEKRIEFNGIEKQFIPSEGPEKYLAEFYVDGVVKFFTVKITEKEYK